MNSKQKITLDYKSLIITYLTNEITDEEKDVLLNWIESDKKHEKIFISVREAWKITEAEREKSRFDSVSAWKTVAQNIHRDTSENDIRFKRKSAVNLLRIAASWLVFFALGLTAAYLFKDQRVSGSSKPVVISVPLGARSNMVLPDGTKIWLNAGTTITYNQDYGIRSRSLHLTGEAFFDVAKDKSRPFIVNVTGLKIQALGTRFNVKAYSDEQSVLTTLEEGKIVVQLLKPQGRVKSVVLSPNENILFMKADNVLTVPESEGTSDIPDKVTGKELKRIPVEEIKIAKNIKTELFTSWKDDRWILDGEPLGTLAPMLERRFNVKITFKDKELKNYNFTGIIENETIEQIMVALDLTSPIDIEISKDSIILALDPAMENQFKRIMRSNRP